MIDWASVYGELVTIAHWTWDQIDAFNFPRLKRLHAYWEKHPPVHLMMAARHGFGAADPGTKAPKDKPRNIGELLGGGNFAVLR